MNGSGPSLLGEGGKEEREEGKGKKKILSFLWKYQ